MNTGIGRSLHDLGVVAKTQGDYVLARHHFRASLIDMSSGKRRAGSNSVANVCRGDSTPAGRLQLGQANSLNSAWSLHVKEGTDMSLLCPWGDWA